MRIDKFPCQLTSAGLLAIALLMACGQPRNAEIRSDQGLSFTDRLNQGRQVNSAEVIPINAQAAAIDQAERDLIVAVENDLASGSVAFATFDIDLMAEIDEAGLAQWAAQYLETKRSWLGVGAGELKPSDPSRTAYDRYVTLSFERFHQGLLVRDALVQLTFWRKDSGKLVLRDLKARTYGSIALAGQATGPDANDILAALGRDDLVVKDQREVIYSREVGGRYEFHRSREVMLEDGLTGVRYFVTASGQGGILEAFSDHLSKRAMAEVYDRSYIFGDKTVAPLTFATVSLNGREARVDEQGRVALSGGGRGTIKLGGGIVTLHDLSSAQVSEPYAFAAQFAADGATIKEGGADFAALNAFTAVGRVRAFAKRHLPDLPYLDMTLRLRVNANQSCNATYSGRTLTFYRESDRCANTALINDITYHEWGHGLDDYTGPNSGSWGGGITDGPFSEAIGDIVAAYMTGNHVMAPGFYKGSTGGIRNLQNQRRYPEHRGGGVHQEGLIIGGAFWDLRQALIARHGESRGKDIAERLFFKHLLTTGAYRDSYQAVLRLDDDDGNPRTRSPNHCLITKAFAAHGLATEEVGCQDGDPQTPDQPIDASLYLAVADGEQANELMLWAVADQAAKISLCLGGKETCLKGGAAALDFVYRQEFKSKRLFQSSKRLELTTRQQKITLLSHDATGKPLGYREATLTRGDR